MNYDKNVRLMGESSPHSDWIPPARRKWIPRVKKPKTYGLDLPKPRKQWKNNSSNNLKGGKR